VIVKKSRKRAPAPPPRKPLTITTADAEHASGLCRRSIWNKIADGTLTTVKVGRRTLIQYDSFERMLGVDAA
jgi:hypothetical protein